jgi:hypothetical protein
MKALANLKRFVRDICANFYEGGCVFDKPCCVTQGKRCGYFEKAVLHKPDYPYPHKCFVEDPAHEEVVRYEYSLIGGAADSGRVSVRRCECGAPLMKRQRLCAKCCRLKRRASNRKSQLAHWQKIRAKTAGPSISS